MLMFFQVLSSLLYGHSARYFRHGGQQGQAAVGQFYGLVSQAYRFVIDHRPGQRLVGSEVKIGEQQLALFDQLVFRLDRLFYLYDHFCFAIHFLNIGEDMSARLPVFFIREPTADSGSRLNIYAMASLGEFQSAGGGQRHAVLAGLNFLGYANNHYS